MGLKDIIKDYHILNKRIELEYDVRFNQGGHQKEVWDAYVSHGVGTNFSDMSNLRADSFVLATMRHPIKSFLCMTSYYFEKQADSAR